MMRTTVAGAKRKERDTIRWRNHEVLRIEAFSDAVFAFAVTLLIVSLEVPKTFEELLQNLKGFFPFAICFTFLFQIWYTQNIFFRRFGLHDIRTVVLNGIMLFMVLFFVYPLKFLFTAFLSHNAVTMFGDPGQLTLLFCIYGGGFAGIYLLFALMYHHALRLKDDLELTASEQFAARTDLYQNMIMVAVGALSIMIAIIDRGSTGLAGMVYIIIGPAIGMLHARRGRAHRLRFTVPEEGL